MRIRWRREELYINPASNFQMDSLPNFSKPWQQLVLHEARQQLLTTTLCTKSFHPSWLPCLALQRQARLWRVPSAWQSAWHQTLHKNLISVLQNERYFESLFFMIFMVSNSSRFIRSHSVKVSMAEMWKAALIALSKGIENDWFWGRAYCWKMNERAFHNLRICKGATASSTLLLLRAVLYPVSMYPTRCCSYDTLDTYMHAPLRSLESSISFLCGLLCQCLPAWECDASI